MGRERLLYEMRPLAFLCHNLTSGREKRTLTSGSGHYLVTYKVNATHFCWNFDDLEVFYKEINFCNKCLWDYAQGRLCEHDSNQSHTHQNVPRECGSF